MHHLASEFTNAFARAQTKEQVFDVTCAASEQLTYPFCIHVVRIPLPILNFPAVQFDNFSGKKVEASSCVVGDAALAQFALDAGVRIDWVKAIRSYCGACSTLALGRAGDGPAMDGPSRERLKAAPHLLELAHARVTEVLFGELLPEARAKFSSKELEVLRWTGEGKTLQEIGMIMGLSTATINFHIKSLVQKTGSVNRLHAAVRAAALGILGPVAPSNDPKKP